ncbi:MAG: hypothetical protein J0L97_05535 [Alphaproteobacteria bacterium]|nr:hypothetical protein [Alphaproteobacteria bacterium]
MKPTLAIIFLCLASLPLQAKEHFIQVVSDYKNMRMVFEPPSLSIKKGDKVTWVNQADESHNMVTYPDGFPKGAQGFVSPYLEKKGEKWSHTFTNEGTYQYHCIPHVMMGMRGTVTVEKPTPPGGFHKPTVAESKTYRDMMLKFFDEEDFKHMPAYVSERLKK